VKVWDLNTKAAVDTLTTHEDNVWAAKYSSDGKLIGSGKDLVSSSLGSKLFFLTT
jgi:WD40 repeat protein